MSELKPCPYCGKNAVLGFDGESDGISINGDSSGAVIESDTWEFPIHFCPMCGKRLDGCAEPVGK